MSPNMIGLWTDRSVARAAGWFSVVLGLTVILGWALGIDVLKRGLAGRVAMNPGATAPCFILAGLALAIEASVAREDRRWLWAVRVCAVVVGLIAVSRGLGYLLDWDGGLDRWFFQASLEAERELSGHSNRMAPNTACAFLLVGLALGLCTVRHRQSIWAAQLMAITASVLALLALIGYLYSSVSLARIHEHIPMALTTSVGLLVLSGGILAHRADAGVMSVLTGQGAGGLMARRLLPAAILLPTFLGWLRWVSQGRGYLDAVTGISLLVVATILTFSGLIWWNAALLERMDSERTRAERRSNVQNRVSRILADSPSVDDAIPRIIEAVCRSLDWSLGAFWKPGEKDERLKLSELWNLPELAGSPFAERILTTEFPRSIGLPGRVWSSGRPAWIFDVTVDSNFPRASAAAASGLHGAVAFPIFVQERFLGVIELFSTELQPPDEILISILGSVGSQIGQFMMRKQAETLASHERFLLETLMDNVPDAIYFKDLEGRFLRINRSLANRFHLQRPDCAVGRSDADYFAPDHAIPAREDELRVMQTGEPMVGKEEHETWGDGTVSWSSSTKLPFRDEAGRLIGTFGVSRDITPLKVSERAALLSAQRFKSLIEATSNIVWSTPQSGEFEEEQPEWSKFTGQTFEQLKGWGWLDAVHPDDREHTTQVWTEAVSTRTLYQVEHRLRRADGAYVPMRVRAVPILNERGEIGEWVGVHSDIEAEKRAEDALRTAKELAESASRAKSDFLANMSHEIRTPLNGIIGMTELVLETALNKEQRDYLGMVKISADHLLNVINDILDFSKIEAGRLDLELTEFALRDSLDDTLATLALRAHKKGLELASHVVPEVPDLLLGDPHRLRQVLVNLVGNAIKFTASGEVVLHVDLKRLDQDEAELHFAVRDTGIGISETDQGRLFRAFTQADTSTTRKYGGTGLGLAISSRLVKLMRGEIWIESQPGKGSTFHFTARFGVLAHDSALPSPDRTIPIHDLPVLIVDDNETNRLILIELLASWGMKPTAVNAGAQALSSLRAASEGGHPFALVLLDAMMPEMDGFTLAERIGESHLDQGPTLMMLSSANRSEDLARCRELGVATHLTKPIKQSTLLDAIMTSLGRSVTVDDSQLRLHLRGTGAGAVKSLRLMLAEDNAVNQRLAVSLLEKRGHSVVVVNNGREALAMSAVQPFDAAFMDVQMPEMDGFEATAAIRERERSTGEHLTIIAMTAHALKGDRERCLEAGMDDYLSKPLRPVELDRILALLADSTAAKSQPADKAEPPGRPASGPPVSLELALARVDGDEALLRELGSLFLAELPSRIQELRAATAQRDATALAGAAHTLKGSVANFDDGSVLRSIVDLEALAKARALDRIPAALTLAEAELARLEMALAGLAAAPNDLGGASPGPHNTGAPQS